MKPVNRIIFDFAFAGEHSFDCAALYCLARYTYNSSVYSHITFVCMGNRNFASLKIPLLTAWRPFYRFEISAIYINSFFACAVRSILGQRIAWVFRVVAYFLLLLLLLLTVLRTESTIGVLLVGVLFGGNWGLSITPVPDFLIHSRDLGMLIGIISRNNIPSHSWAS